ncbi:sugar phosphate isomerase/epimerase family protein [Desulfonatronovibrio hydrogenovorans]|uniref:sugar phosphate isomerase/epimerase family protein n=1 Tax=Desulfonatronovibrio hydrogenovorans TaxID=53245 RepID=UPI00048D0A24|nr:TIM barrel protein [Desulfonatronovibrio hydrogenovorans]
MLKTYPSLYPLLAFTGSHHDPEARTAWVLENSHGLEYSPDPDNLDQLHPRIIPLIKSDIPVRFHTRYFQYELGHADQHLAEQALEVHARTIKRIRDLLGQAVVTVHTGLCPDLPVKPEQVRENLCRLVEYADSQKVTVCLENLRQGHASDPFQVLEWAVDSGAMITMDLGHALGCPMVLDNRITPMEIAEMFAPRLFEVHVYGREDEAGHHPITDMEPLGPVLDRLLLTSCQWWTIELGPPDQAMSTRELLEAYFAARHQKQLMNGQTTRLKNVFGETGHV